MRVDVELLEAWRGGDSKAADELVQRHFDAIYRFFRAKLSDDAEDLVQRTFLACVEGRDRIGDAGFRAYLFGVARRQLMGHLRHKYRDGADVDIAVVSIADLATTPSRKVARQQKNEWLLVAMQTLPVDTQIILELAYWEGLSGREIAAAVEIEENTVRSRLARSRVALKAALNRLMGAEAAASLLSTIGRH